MKKKTKMILIVCAAILGVGLIVGEVIWRTDYAQTKVLTAVSKDNQYRLTVCMVGEPDFPYGATHCRAALYKGKQQLSAQDFSVQNDGAIVKEDNFSISWDEAAVTLTANGTEQENEEIVLNY
jgi:hypothetical protein